DQDEGAHANISMSQKLGGSFKMGQSKPFVQPEKNVRVDRLQPHRDFQSARQKVSKLQSTISNQPRMRFHYDVFYSRNPFCDSRIIGVCDGRGIEKTAAVIKFKLVRKAIESG